MDFKELVNWCNGFTTSYIQEHVEEIHTLISDAINDSNTKEEIASKLTIDAISYSVQLSALTTAAILQHLGLVDANEGKMLNLPKLGHLPQ